MGGGDKLFQKRKAKQAKDLKRRQAKRAPYEKVLIVCEGEKTEPNYFRELRDHNRLNTANVVVSGDCASAPIRVVEEAKRLYREAQRKGDSYDRVYCVFDKDTHDTYERALDTIRSATPKGVFYAITSVPCFEFWLLLHFVYTTQPFYGIAGGKSAGEQVVDELNNYIPGYAKGDEGYFDALIEGLPRAIQNSRRVREEGQRIGTDNPSTLVHELVEYLQELEEK